MLAGERFNFPLAMIKAANTTISFLKIWWDVFSKRDNDADVNLQKSQEVQTQNWSWGTFVHFGICACGTIVSLSLDEWSLSTLISRSRVAKIIMALMQQTSALCSHWFVYWLNYCYCLGFERRSNIKVESLKMQIMRTHQQYAWCTNTRV